MCMAKQQSPARTPTLNFEPTRKLEQFMASVSILRSIANNTPYTLSIRNGESKSDLFSIGAQSAWNGCMNVPWIGKVSENYKAIELVMGAKAETTLWLFQDYWEPAHENAVKYLFGPEMD